MYTTIGIKIKENRVDKSEVTFENVVPNPIWNSLRIGFL